VTSGAQKARETVAALYPDGVLPDGEFTRLAKTLGVHSWVMQRAVITVRADLAMCNPHREPHETPWLSEYRRGVLDGVLAAQGYRIVTIEPPPGAQPPCEIVAEQGSAVTGGSL
jgi:hypothetical protein